jgi:ABC-type Fe3+-citrate transport system substrate-binding protein
MVANSNSTEYVINTLDGVGKTQFNKAVKITQDNIKAQKIASDMIGGTQKDFIDETQKELVTSALLSRYGINNENITNVSNPNLAVAMEVLSKYNITPTAVIKKLNTKINVDYNNAGMIQEYKNNLSLYNLMKSKYPGLVVDNEFMYQEGNLMGALSMQDDPTLASKLNSIAKDIPKNKENKIKLEQHLGLHAKETRSIMKDLISELDVNTDTNWLS